ncbi:MAG TPA: molybdopterin-dependent oxidoreductase [Candidatus Acidoferrales bacterium]|jgi:DMSO/TMAO reductase YedYZ molybdopterin-dependent catalytic subunit|nr:molybdopterin-dependent oxidoreductase [Candidatus Acidoferrales bacterium]
MTEKRERMSRRALLKALGAGSGALMLGSWSGLHAASQDEAAQRLPSFTGPGANQFWNSVGPVGTYPQKLPLIVLTDRPVQLETPRQFFLSAITPNSAFYVRWHLDEIPSSVDLSEWRLHVEGNVEKPLTFSMADLLNQYKPVSVTAVNQCSGNSRSRFRPRVAGGQWGNGAMGNAKWTGLKLSELLRAAGVKKDAAVLQFQGLDRGKGPEGLGSNAFLKSIEASNPVLDECVLAYAMNDDALPMLNGFPLRLVVPGYFATYWVKALSWIRVLQKPDENFWMKTGYRIPDTPRGTTTPDDVKAGKVKTVPIHRMPVRSFVITPDGSGKIPAKLPVTLRGIAFSGYGRVVKVEVSTDDGKTWRETRLGEDLGPHSFRMWEHGWTPERAGRYTLAVRATDEKANVQPDDGVWNPGGYLWNRIERQEILVGTVA